MTSTPNHPSLAELDQITSGVFSAATSGERSARLREWLQSEPSQDLMHEVYRELSARDKGAAKALREKLDELKRARSQDALAAEWVTRAEQLLASPRLYLADAMAWQRDAAKAGAPLSREPLATLKNRLAEWVKGVEDAQHQAMVLRESSVLLSQRIELLSTKPLAEAREAQAGLQEDVASWQLQLQRLCDEPHWRGVDLKFPTQLESSRAQMLVVWESFSAALALAQQALQDAQAPLPAVPVWAEDLRRLRGQAVVAEVSTAVREAKPSKPDAAERQAMREQATAAVLSVLEAVEKEVAEGHGKATAGAASSLRQVLKTHGRHLDPALDARVHQALTAAGELEGWQRWRADQLRQDLLKKAEALLVGEEKKPAMGGRKLQETLRELREAWKLTDQGGLPNHSLWKRFDAACNQAHEHVQAWLDQMRQESAAHRAQRQALMDEVKAWVVAHAESSAWREQIRDLHQFSERWRHAGHLGEKTFAEMQQQWKQLMREAGSRLDAAQKASLTRRQELIAHARELGAAVPLRVDAIKALQQAWQAEAQAVPLDRKNEQKLWEQFRAPLDEAFQRKGQERQQAQAALSERDRDVLQAAQALDAANASGDVARIREAMAALEAARLGQDKARAQADRADRAATAGQASPVASPAAPEAVSSPADAVAEVTDEAAPSAPAVAPVKAPRPVVAVRGDDRPGQKKTEVAPPGRRDGRPGERRDGRDARPGDRGGRFGAERGERRFGERGDESRADRGPRLGDAAFRAQRDAMERAEQSLRKLAAQAHGEALTQLLTAWEGRQAEQMPTAHDLGRAVSAAIRQAWTQAIAQTPRDAAADALLRLEMAAEVPTPAEHLNARRALQLQLLTRRNDPSPAQTWGQDVASVLAGPYDAASARRLQSVLKALLRR